MDEVPRNADARRAETALAQITLAFLVVYVPVETYVSWSDAYWLLNPFYLVDLGAMLLLFWGAVRSLRARPRQAPGVLCAAYGWATANGWRATWDRAFDVMEGGSLTYGTAELSAVGCATACGLICFGLSLWLVARAERPGSGINRGPAESNPPGTR